MTSPVSADTGPIDASMDRWIADAEQLAARYQQLSVDVTKVSVTESTPDGLITVTVNSGGLVTDLRIADRVTGMPGQQVAAGVLLAMRRAQSRIAGRVAEVMQATIGQDRVMVDAVLNNYHNTFPAPKEPARPEPVAEVRIGEAERPAPLVSPPPARTRRPTRQGMDEDWASDNGSFLEEVDG